MQNKLVNYDLHYNYMKHVKDYQTSPKQKHGMPKYDQKPTETQSTHARMRCSFERLCKGLLYTCKIDIKNGKTISGKRL